MTRLWRPLGFVSLVVIQVIVVIGMAADPAATLRSGDEVTLRTQPIDPRDLLRGDYVVLRYDISTIDLTDVTWDADAPYLGQKIAVTLETNRDGYGVPVAVLDPNAGPDDMFIRGRVTETGVGTVRVEYRIEEYFVPEGEGHIVELADQVDVVVVVSDSGAPVLDHLVVDGSVWP